MAKAESTARAKVPRSTESSLFSGQRERRVTGRGKSSSMWCVTQCVMPAVTSGAAEITDPGEEIRSGC